MSAPAIRRVGIVGTGVIGASWAAFFLARNLDVTATDPAPGAEQRLRDAVQRHWPALERMGLADGSSLERLRFEPALERALDGCDFVQENGPERAESQGRPVCADGCRRAAARAAGQQQFGPAG